MLIPGDVGVVEEDEAEGGVHGGPASPRLSTLASTQHRVNPAVNRWANCQLCKMEVEIALPTAHHTAVRLHPANRMKKCLTPGS